MWRFGAFGQGVMTFAENMEIDAELQEKVDSAFSLMHDKKNRNYTKAIQLLNEVLIVDRFKDAERALEQPKFAKDALYGKSLYFYQESLKCKLELAQPHLIEACFNLSRIRLPSPSHLILHARCLRLMKQFDLAFEKIEQAREILKQPDCPYTSAITITKWNAQIKALTRIIKPKVTPSLKIVNSMSHSAIASCLSCSEEEGSTSEIDLSVVTSVVDMVFQETPKALTPQLNHVKSKSSANPCKSKSKVVEPKSEHAEGKKRKHRGGRTKCKNR